MSSIFVFYAGFLLLSQLIPQFTKETIYLILPNFSIAVKYLSFIRGNGDHCFLFSIPFRVYGLLGTIRISVKEHFIYDNHEENPKPDLRLASFVYL